MYDLSYYKKIKQFYAHPNYENSERWITEKHDTALVELYEELDLIAFNRPACLQDQKKHKAIFSEPLIVTG